MYKNILSKIGWKLFLFFLLPLFATQAFAQQTAIGTLENQVQKAVARAMASSVYLTDYDQVSKAPVGSRFSGVTVSADGTILTVGHTTVPGGSYMVTFPDGRECTATCLGRISGIDAAMLKINEQGVYPFAEMGWSSSLKENEPCIGISYPASFESNIMLVRFGYIAERSTTQRANRIRTTLLMEPGDSGGPAFDLLGRVIGMHSSIDSSLVNNFEVPIDLYRKYWYALHQQVDYQTLPMGEVVSEDTLSTSKSKYNDLSLFEESFSKIATRLNLSVLKLSSMLHGKNETVNATLVSLKGIASDKESAGKSYLLSKNSMVGEHPFINLSLGKQINARVVARDELRDLILLELPIILKHAIAINIPQSGVPTLKNLGKFLFSAQPLSKGVWSVAGTNVFDLPRRFRAGYAGAYPIMKDGKLVIGMVTENSAAKIAKLHVGDQVMRINGVSVDTQEAFMKEMKKTFPGDEVRIVRNVSGIIDTVKIKMLKYPVFADLHPAERFFGGKSVYRDGYDGIFVHDAKIIPAECGGPVFDIQGNFLGMNIARFSRTSSITISTTELKSFITRSLKDKTVLKSL